MKTPIIYLLLLLVGCSSAPDATFKMEKWQPRTSLNIVFSGDFMQHLPQVNAARRGSHFQYDSTLRLISPYWQRADFTVINLETTLNHGPHYTGYPMFRSPREIAGALYRSGVTHCALANNHAMDGGLSGVRTTIRTLDSVGLGYFGVRLKEDSLDRIQYLKKGPFKVAVLNYTYGTNGMPVPRGVEIDLIDTISIKRDIATAVADSATHIITFFHWGDEYARRSNRFQRELGLWCRENGADVVVGSHPHVVQEIDSKYKIVYSLGNFVSNQRERYKDGGISVRITIYDGLDGSLISFLPHSVDRNYNIVFDNDQSLSDSRKAVNGR